MNNLVEIIMSLTVWVVVKWFLVVGLVMYTAFAGVVVRQVGVMGAAIEDDFNGVVKIFAWAHLLLAILLLVIAIVFL